MEKNFYNNDSSLEEQTDSLNQKIIGTFHHLVDEATGAIWVEYIDGKQPENRIEHLFSAEEILRYGERNFQVSRFDICLILGALRRHQCSRRDELRKLEALPQTPEIREKRLRAAYEMLLCEALLAVGMSYGNYTRFYNAHVARWLQKANCYLCSGNDGPCIGCAHSPL